MLIDCIGCLHGHFPELEGGDLLIVTGDLTASDKYQQYIDFFDWIYKQDYRKKIFTCGNHDNQAISQFEWFDSEYLCDSGTEFEGFKIWGSPWSLWFKGINPNCKSFTGSENDLKKKYELIPRNTDILITHGPPFGIWDGVSLDFDGTLYHTGSRYLRNISMEIQPKLHVFSHIHEWGGKLVDTTLTKYVNCSHMNEHYKPVNKPIRIIL